MLRKPEVLSQRKMGGKWPKRNAEGKDRDQKIGAQFVCALRVLPTCPDCLRQHLIATDDSAYSRCVARRSFAHSHTGRAPVEAPRRLSAPADRLPVAPWNLPVGQTPTRILPA